MVMAPPDPTDCLRLADWMEVETLVAPQRSASRTEVLSLLRIGAVGDQTDEDRIILDAFGELERRSIAADSSYPFIVDGSLLTLRSDNWRNYAAYVFCLLVSYKGVQEASGLNPKRLFEEIASIAAQRYLVGQARHFGFPRPRQPKSFAGAVSNLCQEMREGEGYHDPGYKHDAKDDAVDIIAWRPFQDNLPGKMLLFGQCAAGSDWYGKRSDRDPKAFCDMWMKRPPVSPMVKAFFIPHRLESERWEHLGRYAGIVFDRCRIAYFSHGEDSYSRHIRWSESVLRKAL